MLLSILLTLSHKATALIVSPDCVTSNDSDFFNLTAFEVAPYIPSMDEEGNLIYPLQGRRIFVLSLQGETLQVYTHPDEGHVFDGLCCFDGKLLAPVRDRQSRLKDVMALCGV